MDGAEWSDTNDSMYASASSGSNDEYDDDELVDYDELDDVYVPDMKGSMILPGGKIMTVIRNEMCCKKCTISWYKNYMNNFI